MTDDRKLKILLFGNMDGKNERPLKQRVDTTILWSGAVKISRN